jgi:uncharacterized membrane protein YoaT (DUF817 family)
VCVCLCECVYICGYTHTYMCKYTQSMCVCMCVYFCGYTHTYMCKYICVCMCECVYICCYTHTYMCKYTHSMCVYACVNVCKYVALHTHTCVSTHILFYTDKPCTGSAAGYCNKARQQTVAETQAQTLKHELPTHGFNTFHKHA